MKPDVLRGHLDAMILAVLEDEPRHGYAIMEALQRASGGALDLPTGTLYPALRRLERAGLLHSEWATVGGRKRRTYRLTSEGSQTLAAERVEWRSFAVVVEEVLKIHVARPSGAL
ncbi:PadR family transcriptional regulator [Virgisporangium aliadipatigenens]|uniref:PadR family transcriptional regulator n=1 Tax=Virgisporangium aliadipatigenens TaxID=741659 RepID=A0A8J3YSC9_9ACTN|nr:helix-turn-helix transcriptional regulator [Virgisporangium aliadipatigenens]GIJ48995.1 PadR family transcriptional regulator [Virgisporangium aliadipatigenens]